MVHSFFSLGGIISASGRRTLSEFFLSRPYDVMMFTICILYALTAIPTFEINGNLEDYIVLGSLPVLIIKLARREGDNNIFWLFIVAVIIQIASWLNSMDAIPEYANSHPKLKPLSSLFVFVLIAFWIDGVKTRIFILYSSLIVGFVGTAIYDSYLTDSIWRGLHGERIDYGMHNAQLTSMLSIVVLMLSVYLNSYVPKHRSYIILHILFGFIIAFSLFSLLASQSRQALLASGVLLFFLPFLFYRSFSIKKVMLSYLALVALTIAVTQIGSVRPRITEESESIHMVLNRDWDSIPIEKNNVGIRVHSWIEASKWIAENPILGTDYSSVSLVLRTSEKFQTDHLKGLGHLHNFYFETLVAYGFIGLLFFALFYTEVTKNVLKHSSYREQVLLLCFLLIWAILNFFESFNDKDLGIYAQTIFLAGLYRYRKPARDQDNDTQSARVSMFVGRRDEGARK